MDQRCPYCHQSVAAHLYRAHVADHTRLLEDGQMADHVTLAPEHRFQGELQAVPQWYRHDRCGAVTGMPEEIIRSYLADPFLYSDYTFCTGCGKYPHASEFHWVDTGENLLEYNRRLRVEHIQRNGLNPNDFVWKNGAPERRKRKISGVLIAGGCLAVVVVMVGLVVAGAGAIAMLLHDGPAEPGPTAPAFASEPPFADPAFETHLDLQRQMDEMRREHERMIEDLRNQRR